MNRPFLFQVTAPAILTGVVLVGVCLGAAWSIHRLQSNLGHILSDNVASLQAAQNLENEMRQMRYHSLLYLMRPDSATLEQIESDERSFEDAFDRAQGRASTPAEEGFLDQIGAGYQRSKAEMAQLRAAVARPGRRKDFVELARTHPIRHIVKPCHQLGTINREQLEQTAAESDALSTQTWRVLLLIG